LNSVLVLLRLSVLDLLGTASRNERRHVMLRAQFHGFLLTVLLLLSASANAAGPNTAPAAGLVLKISTSWTDTLFLPISSDDQKFALVPVPGAAAAIKIVPRREGGRVIVDVLGVFGDTTVPCNQLEFLSTEHLGSFRLKKGEEIETSLPSTFSNGSVHIKLSSSRTETPLGIYLATVPQGCCGCSGLYCCPNAGQCLDCGGCGRCCDF
jgi:hypothetical protein